MTFDVSTNLGNMGIGIVFPQLTYRTNDYDPVTGIAGGRTDCGPASVAMALHIASQGLVSHLWPPNIDTAIYDTRSKRRSQYMVQIREKGSMARWGDTNYSNLKVAFKSYTNEFLAVGKQAPKLTNHVGSNFNTTLIPSLLNTDYWTLIGVNYARLITEAPMRLGQCSMGVNVRHYILIGQYNAASGGTFTILDPLTDGRCSPFASNAATTGIAQGCPPNSTSSPSQPGGDGDATCIVHAGPIYGVTAAAIRTAAGVDYGYWSGTSQTAGLFSGFVFTLSPNTGDTPVDPPPDQGTVSSITVPCSTQVAPL